jgi:DNA-damage-inducible protein D
MSEIQKSQSPFDALKRVDERGEFWMARDLMGPTDYTDWRHFQRAINDARTAMTQSGYDVAQHFSLAPTKNADQGKRGRPGVDWRLSRTACHFVFLNGDPRKPGIAAAQQYFVVQTQFAENVQQAMASKAAVMPNHIEALRGWADALEAQQKAELQAAEAKAEAEMLRPPAEAWNVLVEGADGDYSMAEAAAILNRDPAIETGQNRLRDWMINNRMMYRRGRGQLVPYSEHLPHIRLKPQTRPDHDADDPRARKEANAQVRITAKGLAWIQQHMRDQTKPVLIPSPREPEPVHKVSKPLDMQEFRAKYERLRAQFGNQ